MSALIEQATRMVQTLKQRELFMTTVESCTGGGFSNWITNISGASEVFQGGRVTYSNEEKLELGVPLAVIDQYTVYSLETALAMAEAGIRKAVRADVGVGITGSISRIDPANPGSRPGEVYIAVVFGDLKVARKFIFSDAGERWDVKDLAIEEALNMVLEIL
ncbi:MAG: CinA family protein [Verrucomicrobiota bacterium]